MLTTTMYKEKETKNTVRYQEVVSDQPPIIGTLYIQKYAIKRIGDPDRIKVTIEKE